MPLDLLPDDGLLRARAELVEAVETGAIGTIARVMAEADRKQRGWGTLKLEAMRAIGEWYSGKKRRRGRPKMSEPDNYRPLTELGISRQDANRAEILAQIPQDLFDMYIAEAQAPSYAELIALATELGNGRKEHWGKPVWPRSTYPKIVGYGRLAELRQRLRGMAAAQDATLVPNVEWLSPAEIFEAMAVEFDQDVCSPGRDVVPWIPARRHITKRENGLSRPWQGFVWMNPPYGVRNGICEWIDRFIQHGHGVALVADFTSTEWWHDLTGNADAILFCKPKIQFLPRIADRANALGSTLVGVGPQGVRALRNAERSGRGTMFLRVPQQG